MRQTDILSPQGDDFGVQEKKKYKEIYESIAEKTEEIVTNYGNCPFDDYLQKLNVTEADYVLALQSKLKRNKGFHRRNLNERYINAYNKMIFSLWQANMDIQFIIDPHATGAYVNDYLFKSNAE